MSCEKPHPPGSPDPDIEATSQLGADPLPTQSTPELAGEFGRYRVQRLLGQGGMGAVYLAEDTQLQRQVALKVPKFAQGAQANTLERFYREARSAARLHHPNICSVFDVGEVNGTHYLSMAYIEGRALDEFIASGKSQPARSVARVVRKLAVALQEAHARGVIHRDLKPANIMIDRRGEPVIMDFGLARQIEKGADARLTSDGAIVGSPAYMSPEQIEGEDNLGPATDVYSLGVVLYELLTGELPFRQTGSVISVLSRILTEPAKSPIEIRPDVPPTLAAICVKCLAKKPGDRYASMQALADDLTAFIKADAQSATTVETPKPATAEAVDPFADMLGSFPTGATTSATASVASPGLAGFSQPPFYRSGMSSGSSPAGYPAATSSKKWLVWSGVAGGAVAAVVVAMFVLSTGGDNTAPPTDNRAVPTPVAHPSVNNPSVANPTGESNASPMGGPSTVSPGGAVGLPRETAGQDPLLGRAPAFRGPPSTAELLQHHDRNGDGQLTRSEVPPEVEAEMFRVDHNQDGVLDRSELADLQRQPPPMPGEGPLGRRPGGGPEGGGPGGGGPGAGGPGPGRRTDGPRGFGERPGPQGREGEDRPQ